MSEERTFSQEEVNEIVKKRLERERNKSQETKAVPDPEVEADQEGDQPADQAETVADPSPDETQADDSSEAPEKDPNEELKAEIEALKAKNERLEANWAESLKIYARQRMAHYLPFMFEQGDLRSDGNAESLMPLLDLSSEESINKSLNNLSMFVSDLMNYYAEDMLKKRSYRGSEQEVISSVFRNRGVK